MSPRCRGAISRRRLAVVPQETVLAFDYSVLEIVLMGRYPHLGAFEVEGPADLAAARTALRATGTAELADRPFRTLSGGEKQRVMIASALAQLDDGPAMDAAGSPPTPGSRCSGSPARRADGVARSAVSARSRGAAAAASRPAALTIVLSTHDLRFAASVCTRVILLSKGRVIAEGPPADVLTPARIGELFDIDPEMTSGVISAEIRGWPASQTSGVISAKERGGK